ncbi:MAG: SpoIIE family protein phosphatase [Rubricoccaceae bacterium]|nr:SpoIIE family protein phosphatase [Rubricoccaceae bacterium]
MNALAPRSPTVPTPHPAVHEHSILIVEDNPTLRRLLEYRIGKHYAVRTAEDGEKALALVETAAPDLIISDIMMPRMDGFALLSALRRAERTAAIPFIFLTSKTDDLSRAKGLSNGVDDYITKPFDIDYVLARVEQIIQRSKVYQTQLNARIGRDFSDRLLPKTLPREPGYRALFFSQPREDGGGDLFDWVRLDDGSYLFTVGDIMGKGLQAKFYAFSFLSYIRSTIHAVLKSDVSPAALMRRVNRMLIQDEVLEETFASLLLLRWHPEQHRVTYCNAGHCRPILLSAPGPGIVEYSDLILGLDPATEYVDKAFSLPEGSVLLCYTDGLNEHVARGGRPFGEGGVALAAAEAHHAEQPIKALLETMLARSEEPRFCDDILVFWLERQA